MTAESLTYLDSDLDPDKRKPKKRTLNFPWSKQTASRFREAEDGADMDPLLAHRSGVERTDEIQTVGDSWQAVRTLTTVDGTYGIPIQVETAVVKPGGSGEAFSDQICTKTSYVHNTSAGIIGLPKQQRTTGTTCAAHDGADPATKLISASRNTYDNQAYGDAPKKGLVTAAAGVDGAGTSYSVVTRTTYDPLGRVRTVAKPGAGTTEMQYTPGDVGGPVTSVTAINAKGHAVITTFDPGRSLALTVKDANGRVIRSEYDALGRFVKGWSPSRSSGGKSPNVEIEYQSAIATSKESRPAAVTTKSLKDDGTYSRQVTIYDGLMRQVQTQAEAHGPGRVVTDTTYNDHGLVDEQTSAYLAKNEPAAELFAPKSKSLVPSRVKFRYDGLERPVSQSTYHDEKRVHEATSEYGDTSTYVDPPGSTSPRTRTFTDALGRVTSIVHHKDDSTTAGRTTTYGYDDRGRRTSVTDPAGNEWTYTYDARGRVTSTTDPDVGKTDTWYDEADRPYKVTDAEQRTTYTDYDELGRVTFVREGSRTSNPVKSFTYDSLSGALGQPVASTRHTVNGDYISRVTGYDTEYRPTGTETVVPANTMTTGVSGTYPYKYTYTQTGKPQTVTLPSVGGLAQEKVVTRYNSDGLTESTSGLAWYTSDVTYSPYGEPLRTVSGSQPTRVWTTNFVDPYTGRLQRTVADRETAGPHRISDSYYAYDKSGVITSNARQLSDASGDTWDTQCFTYDVLGELANAWTSNIAPAGNGTGCKSANGTTWGPRKDYAASSGPVADASDTATDTSSPDASLKSTLAATAPAANTVSTGATAYHQSFTFDWLGNRATLTEADPADATKNVTFTYGYNPKQPHTMTSIGSSPAGQSSTYTYDAVGNTTVRNLVSGAQDLKWTSEDKLDTIKVGSKKTTYVYDATGNRLLENSPSGSTLYLGETEVSTSSAGAVTRASRSYGQSGAPMVTRTATSGATTGHQLSALLADHLGTANTAVALASGQAVTRRAAKPYGELRGPKPASWPNKRGYIGVGIEDTTTGLTHIGAREYDQNSGRFISADPIIDIADPLQMNGYAYSNNSPVSNSDPTGLCLSCGEGYPIGGTGSNGTEKRYVGARQGASQGGGGATHQDPGSYMNKRRTIVYPGVEVPTGWKGREEFDDRFTELLDGARFTNGQLPSYLSDSENPHAQQQLGYWALNVCWAMKSCPAELERKFREQSAGFSSMVTAAGDTGMRRTMPGKGARGANSSCSKCFLAGTDVLMADGTTKDIEDIELGDEVQATDPETGETGAREVTRLIVTEDDKHFNELSIATEDGVEQLTATYEHPFWSPSEDEWIEAGDLESGMTLLTDEGSTVIVTGNRAYTQHARTYNLTVDDLHTYYVLAGETPVLVHNSSGCLTMSSAIGGDSSLVKAAQQAGKNQKVQADLDSLFQQLSRGNMNPGLGSKALSGTDVTYARGRNGGRLFFRNVDGGIQVVGKSDKANESKVIARLNQLYGQ
jgi:RHS repeat-associated protein